VAGDRENRFLIWRISPIMARRLANFRANRRGTWSLAIFLALFAFSLFAEFIANDRPLLIRYEGALYSPVLKDYPETSFGGDFPTTAKFTDEAFLEEFSQRLKKSGGWTLWPLIRFSYDTQVPSKDFPKGHKSAPTPLSAVNWLGTDDQGRDVAARLIYGFRISILFGIVLTVLSTIVGVAAGAVQGYFGGRIDLYFQRFIEVWDSIPLLYVLIILSALVQPNFWWLLCIMLLFAWMNLVGVVRAEFLRTRNFDYVRAARALGARDRTIMFRHVLPNAMVATITYMPFVLQGSIVSLTALDFLGFGLPAGSPSLGELLRQGKANLHAPWLGISAFLVIAIMLSLLIFIGEAVRDAFDPRKAVTGGVPPEEAIAGTAETSAVMPVAATAGPAATARRGAAKRARRPKGRGR